MLLSDSNPGHGTEHVTSLWSVTVE